jgi:hypothetical protein
MLSEKITQFRLSPLFPLSLVLASLPLLAQQTVSRVPFSEESAHTIRAFSAAGEITLPVVRLQLDIRYPAGKQERGNLIVVYDPQTGHYFWRYSEVHRNTTASFLDALESGVEAAYAGPDALVDFYVPGSLYSLAHPERAENMSAAREASIGAIQRGLPAFEKSGYHTDAAEENVAKAIGTSEFSCAPYPESGQNCGFKATIVSISHEGDKWRLVLRSRWDQEVTLDSKFKLISTRRLPDQKKEWQNGDGLKAVIFSFRDGGPVLPARWRANWPAGDAPYRDAAPISTRPPA